MNPLELFFSKTLINSYTENALTTLTELITWSDI